MRVFFFSLSLSLSLDFLFFFFFLLPSSFFTFADRRGRVRRVHARPDERQGLERGRPREPAPPSSSFSVSVAVVKKKREKLRGNGAVEEDLQLPHAP